MPVIALHGQTLGTGASPFENSQVDFGDSVHITADRRESIGGSSFYMFKRKGLVSHRFEIETEIEAGIELALEFISCGRQDVLRAERTAEHFVDLAHGDTRIGAYWK